MLYAIFKINDTTMYLDEKYSLIRVALPEMLNEGHDINNTEIIREFTSWSWNTVPSEISNIDCNLVYQNLLILLGFKFLEDWMKLGNQKNILEKLEEELTEKYDEDISKKLLNCIFKIAIIVCTSRNETEKARLLEEQKECEAKFEKLQDKTKLVEELTKLKKEKAAEIKKLDKILSDNSLLLQEFDERNAKLSEYKKIFSIDNLVGTLKKERRKALSDIDECNKLLDAKTYVETKNKLENSLELLRNIKIPKYKERYKIELQKLFIKCLEDEIYKINAMEDKRPAISLLYIVRYYKFIAFDDERFIKDVDELKEDVERIEGKLLFNLYEIGVLSQITKDIETDVGIIKPFLDTRIMNFANVVIRVRDEGNGIDVEVYDGDILEIEYTIPNLNRVKVKCKKNIKLFAK